MTAAYTPEVAAARERLEEVAPPPNGVIHARVYVRHKDIGLLLADHARLAEEAVKLRGVAKAAKAYHERGTETTYVRLGEALADLGKENEAAK